MAFVKADFVSIWFEVSPIDSRRIRARADLRATSLQAGVPEGAKALWGIDKPRDSEIT